MPNWLWLAAIGAAALLVIGFLVLRGRRRDEFEDDYAGYAEAPYVEPAPVGAEPVAAAPVVTPAPVMTDDALPGIAVPTEAVVHAPDKEDLAAVTDTPAPVAHRPWLEFAFRPVRAGSDADNALVEVELTVGNAGDVRAEDVRIAAFMLSRDHAGEMEQLLISPPEDAELELMTIEPGEGARIDATLAVRREELTREAFSPLVVADARYRLADGREGRTSASFLVGVSDATGELQPIRLDRQRMHHDVEARLHGNLERV